MFAGYASKNYKYCITCRKDETVAIDHSVSASKDGVV